ncbi:MAG: superoxide dismutase [Ni] [Pseudomonadota bacterium]
MHRLLSSLVAISCTLALASAARAHCEVPCGIYDDDLRYKLLQEHAGTIEKSMQQIVDLSKQKNPNYNQIVRWTTNKDEHADEVQHLVSQYFMTQRIKPEDKNYEKKITTLHQMLIAAMKCKQTTDVENVKKLRELTKSFGDLYFAK